MVGAGGSRIKGVGLGINPAELPVEKPTKDTAILSQDAIKRRFN